MSAGSGIQHSEDNRGDTPLRFIQMWFLPSTQGLRPQYGGYAGDAEARKGKLQHIVSDSRGAVKTPVQVSQDLGMWASEVAEGEQVTFDLKEVRRRKYARRTAAWLSFFSSLFFEVSSTTLAVVRAF